MKNKLYQALLLIFLVAGISSCDYLDIVPDERPTEEDAFKDKNAAEVKAPVQKLSTPEEKLQINSTNTSFTIAWDDVKVSVPLKF